MQQELAGRSSDSPVPPPFCPTIPLENRHGPSNPALLGQSSASAGCWEPSLQLSSVLRHSEPLLGHVTSPSSLCPAPHSPGISRAAERGQVSQGWGGRAVMSRHCPTAWHLQQELLQRAALSPRAPRSSWHCCQGLLSAPAPGTVLHRSCYLTFTLEKKG